MQKSKLLFLGGLLTAVLSFIVFYACANPIQSQQNTTTTADPGTTVTTAGTTTTENTETTVTTAGNTTTTVDNTTTSTVATTTTTGSTTTTVPLSSPMLLNTVIPSGGSATFTMGNNAEPDGSTPQHLVTLTRPYSMGRYEVTVGQALEVYRWALNHNLVVLTGYRYYDAAMEHVLFATDELESAVYRQRSMYPKSGYENIPVTMMRWYGAAAFCNFLSSMEGLDPAYDASFKCDFSKNGYRLPTEAEWEYAACGSDLRSYPWGNGKETNRANSFDSGDPWESDPASSKLSPVGVFDGRIVSGYQTLTGASPFGLFDMAGNVAELVEDWFGPYPTGHVTDPVGPGQQDGTISRGGSWRDGLSKLLTTTRHQTLKVVNLDYVGFRVCRTLTNAAQ